MSCKLKLPRAKFSLQRVTQAIIAAFEAYGGASYGLNYEKLDFGSVLCHPPGKL